MKWDWEGAKLSCQAMAQVIEREGTGEIHVIWGIMAAHLLLSLWKRRPEEQSLLILVMEQFCRLMTKESTHT